MVYKTCLSAKLSSWKNWQFFFWPKRLHWVSLLMYGKWGRVKDVRMFSWQHSKNYFDIILQVKKEKWKIDFYSCEVIFIKSGYCKLFLNQEHVLFVISMNFCSRFTIANRFLNLIVNLKYWHMILVKIMLTIAEKSFLTIINVSAYL